MGKPTRQDLLLLSFYRSVVHLYFIIILFGGSLAHQLHKLGLKYSTSIVNIIEFIHLLMSSVFSFSYFAYILKNFILLMILHNMIWKLLQMDGLPDHLK
ncbi:hypothetical protein IC582_013304 [Cucumis melo]